MPRRAESSELVSDRPILPDTAADNLLTTLEVEIVMLTECLVSPGWCLSFAGAEIPGLHYNLTGNGQMMVGRAPPIALAPNVLVITPPGHDYRIAVPATNGARSPLRIIEGAGRPASPIQKFAAGDGEPEVTMICGQFRSSRGERTDIFATMTLPIVETFDPTEHPIGQLKAVLAELAAPRVGTTAMTTALLKQVLVMVLRRKLMRACPDLQGLLLLRDPQVARAFADMVVRPGAPHSLLTLAKAASLSRSAFIERFTRAVGRPPMLALRHMRMRHAADLLKADVLSVKQVASAVGYSSRSSFVRAFRSVHAIDPSAYRASALESGT